MKHYLTLLFATLVMASCAPQLSSTITSSRAPADPGEKVTVIGVADPLPNSAQVIGQFRIGDSGFTVNCNYDRVVALAQQEARKSGGNMIKLTDHKLPSPLGSSCHRIEGLIVFDPEANREESVVTTPSPSNAPIARAQPEISLNQVSSISKWRFGIDAGYSYRTAKLAEGLSSEARELMTKMRSGYVVGMDVHYFPGENYGFGLKAEGIFSSALLLSVNAEDQTYYIGPSLYWRAFDRRLCNAWNMGLSLGYFDYTFEIGNGRLSESYSKGGVGSTVDLGYDIRLGEGNTFLGLKVSIFSGSFKVIDASVSQSGKEERESLNSVRIGAGLRF